MAVLVVVLERTCLLTQSVVLVLLDRELRGVALTTLLIERVVVVVGH
jgi:hypothetical protein